MSDRTQPQPQPGIMEIALYVSGESKLAGGGEALKLSANENPYGCSPAATAAFQAAAKDLNRYPATDHGPLRRAIGDIHGLDPDRIICGVGSDEVLQFVAQAYAGPGDEVITTRHGFAMYPILAHAVGATPVTVDEADRRIDVDAILRAVTERTRIVFLANPANPTGTMLSGEDLRRLIAGLPGDCVLVHDGAYMEFAQPDYRDADLVDAYPNVVMTRTFSKIHGLGGLRIGWGYAQRPIIDVLARLRQPFNLSNAQMAAAEAAMRDTEFTAHCAAENARLRRWLRNQLVQMGVACDESHANFVLARLPDAERARACDVALRDAGIIVRNVASYHLPEALRITVGDEAGCRRVIAAISEFMAGERAAR
ncbi:histidinol-phosphate transaminase [Paracoccus sp. TK19116]|uniref:Histidinol-phosphate aminotransferase n=1 Tax=Paracoccus albicereus TaxID=2922394 RepID=A0ABT1MU66_9RHOB|nr:histidinol-phosphate transaminase [Paracoccus albicereus]MCQ0971741.1 histidinol-phosphate transaminase [Paracoccus albicereus]